MSQINQEYDGQWVYIINCSEDEYGSVDGGEVVIHSKNRDDVYREMRAYDYELSLTSIRYVGKIPEEVVFL